MARQRRRLTGQAYDKRPVSGALPPSPPSTPDALNGAQAHQLASRIDTTQHRYRVQAIRLLGNRRCGVIVVNSHDGSEHTLQSVQDWERLHLGQAEPVTRPAP
jgi:hypothetical protein